MLTHGEWKVTLEDVTAVMLGHAIGDALGVPVEFMRREEMSHYSRLFAPDFGETPEEEIQSTGYVVSTLEAAIWCVLRSDSYRDCVLKAVNLGKDTDTVAAVAGGLAGALYGRKGIPEEWLAGLLRKDMILALCEGFMAPEDAEDSERGGQEK